MDKIRIYKKGEGMDTTFIVGKNVVQAVELLNSLGEEGKKNIKVMYQHFLSGEAKTRERKDDVVKSVDGGSESGRRRTTRRGQDSEEISCTVCYEIVPDMEGLYQHATKLGHEATLSNYTFFSCPFNCKFYCFNESEYKEHRNKYHPNSNLLSGESSASNSPKGFETSKYEYESQSMTTLNGSVSTVVSKTAEKTSDRPPKRSSSSGHNAVPQATSSKLKGAMRVGSQFQAEVPAFRPASEDCRFWLNKCVWVLLCADAFDYLSLLYLL